MYSTSPEELGKLAEMDAEIKVLRDTNQMPQLPSGLEGEDLVKTMQAHVENMPPPSPIPEVQEQTLSYSARDGTQLRLVVHRPSSASGPLPLLVWYHGGGGCIGKPEMTSKFCRDVATTLNCIVVAPQYRLGPQFKFPTGVEDAWDALAHTAGIAASIGADPALGFLMGGESAGAVMGAVLALQAREAKLEPALTGVFLCAGSYFNPQAVPAAYRDLYLSRSDPRCLNAPMLDVRTKAALDACHSPDYTSPKYRAAIWPSHAGLPRHYIQACGMDIHRDDGLLYQDILDKDGVATRLDVYPGCPHCFWHMFGSVEQARKWQADTMEGIKWLLSR